MSLQERLKFHNLLLLNKAVLNPSLSSHVILPLLEYLELLIKRHSRAPAVPAIERESYFISRCFGCNIVGFVKEIIKFTSRQPNSARRAPKCDVGYVCHYMATQIYYVFKVSYILYLSFFTQ